MYKIIARKIHLSNHSLPNQELPRVTICWKSYID